MQPNRTAAQTCQACSEAHSACSLDRDCCSGLCRDRFCVCVTDNPFCPLKRKGAGAAQRHWGAHRSGKRTCPWAGQGVLRDSKGPSLAPAAGRLRRCEHRRCSLPQRWSSGAHAPPPALSGGFWNPEDGQVPCPSLLLRRPQGRKVTASRQPHHARAAISGQPSHADYAALKLPVVRLL